MSLDYYSFANSGSLHSTNCFSAGLSSSENECACCEYTETIDDVLENLFLNFCTCSKKSKSTFAICVSKSCVFATRPALHGVCDHENFMSFEIALCFNGALCNLRNLLVFIVDLWK